MSDETQTPFAAFLAGPLGWRMLVPVPVPVSRACGVMS